MKKTKFLFIAGFAMATLAIVGFAHSKANTHEIELSSLQMENIEALTSGEDPFRLKIIPCLRTTYNECQPSNLSYPSCSHRSSC